MDQNLTDMRKRVLFVLGGLAMGGVETYIARLAKELSAKKCEVDILLLSSKFDPQLMAEVSTSANVIIFERFGYFSASSWLNAFMPFKSQLKEYDVVHVVDLLTLGFVYLNQTAIRFKALSIGIYHSLELVWWEEKNVYFRRKLLELYRRNVSLTLFPSESVAQMASDLTRVPISNMSILPLGIDLGKYTWCTPSIRSRRIVSVGRLVDFKTYNRHVISQLGVFRKFGDFEYYIYGDGPEKKHLQEIAAEHGVLEYVHFMGQIDYEALPQVLNEAFCFIGSGTALIEASAAGVPSIVGIESINTPSTCGFFSEIIGYSYNEAFATTRRVAISEDFERLAGLNEEQYALLSSQHRVKAREFDLIHTSSVFLELSNKIPDFSVSINRWRAIVSFCFAVLRFGPRALKERFNLRSA